MGRGTDREEFRVIRRDRKAPQAIGEKLRRRCIELNHAALEEERKGLKAYFGPQVMAFVEDQRRKLISLPERLAAHRKSAAYFSTGMETVDKLYNLIRAPLFEVAVRESAAVLSEEERIEIVGPKSDREFGRLVQQLTDECLQHFQCGSIGADDPDDPNPNRASVRAAVRRFFDLLLSELKRLNIVGICENCHNCRYPTTATKRFCTLPYEGTNCEHLAGERRRSKQRRQK